MTDSDSGDNIALQLIEDTSPNETLCVAGPSTSKRASKQFLTTKLVTALDRCKVSDRDATHLLIATAKALGQNIDSLVINRSSINRGREKLRKERAIQLREGFQINAYKSSVIHWDGKLLPSLTSKNLVDRLSVIQQKPRTITWCTKIVYRNRRRTS